MQREIKFEYGFQSVNGIVKKVYALSEIPNIATKCDMWNVLPIVYVRQFTGLTDKNGFEIYESDYIDLGLYHGKGVVMYANGGYKVKGNVSNRLIGFGSFAKQVEVIGNIHTNPELIK